MYCAEGYTVASGAEGVRDDGDPLICQPIDLCTRDTSGVELSRHRCGVYGHVESGIERSGYESSGNGLVPAGRQSNACAYPNTPGT